jgi:hypothetical protein
MGTTKEDEMKKARCEICKTRPVMTDRQKLEHGVEFPYCEPCLIQADWENVHSDDNHGPNFTGLATDTDPCWICHPELDETTKPYHERQGSSRAGVKHHVSIRATGREKADQVAAQLGERYTAKIRTVKGVVTLKAAVTGDQTETAFTVSWYVTGQLLGAAITEGGKTRRLRNAAEVIRNA